MDWIVTALVGLIGLAVGSFLNGCIDRLPAGESVLMPASRCRSCRRPLRPPELIPLLSYLVLRGRCRHCFATIPFRVFLVELAAGALFAFVWYVYAFS